MSEKHWVHQLPYPFHIKEARKAGEILWSEFYYRDSIVAFTKEFVEVGKLSLQDTAENTWRSALILLSRTDRVEEFYLAILPFLPEQKRKQLLELLPNRS